MSTLFVYCDDCGVLTLFRRLGTMYNSSRLYAKQEETEKWITEHFPAIWEELMKLGKIRAEDDVLNKINVELELQP